MKSNHSSLARALAIAACMLLGCGGSETTVGIASTASDSPPASGARIEGRVFDASSGPVAGASIYIPVAYGGPGDVSTWRRGGTPLQSDQDGRFSYGVPVGSLLIVVAQKAGFVQPCAVVKEATGDISFDVELVAESTLDASNPPSPLSATGAVTVTGVAYELVGASRQPVAGARLWFGDSIGYTYATTVTDRDGRYLACNLPNNAKWPWGTELWAQKPGYADTTIETIDTSRSTVVDIEMRR